MKKIFLFFLLGVFLLLPKQTLASPNWDANQGPWSGSGIPKAEVGQWSACSLEGIQDSGGKTVKTRVLLTYFPFKYQKAAIGFFNENITKPLEEAGFKSLKLKCIKTFYSEKDLKGETAGGCPQGWKKETGKDFCQIIECSNDGDCYGNSQTCNDGICHTYSIKKECLCPNGQSVFCESPLCSQKGDEYTGFCSTEGFCEKINQSQNSNTVGIYSIVKCTSDQHCWNKNVIRCCNADNQCLEDIDECKNDHLLSAGICPPGFTKIDTDNDNTVDICRGPSCPYTFSDDCTYRGDDYCKKKKGDKYACVEIGKTKTKKEQQDGCKVLDRRRVCVEQKPEDKKPEDKKPEDKKPEDKKPETTIGGPSAYPIEKIATLNQLKVSSVPALIGNIIKTAMGVMGSIALIMFVYGGVMIMTATGSADRQKKGVSIIVWATMGIVVILSSYIIVDFVFEIF